MKKKSTMKLSFKLCVAFFLLAQATLANAQSSGQSSVKWLDSFDKLKGRVVRSMAVAAFDQNLILVGNKGPSAGDATIFISRNGGISWRFLNSNKPLHPSATDVQAVAFVTENIALAGTWKHGLFRSTDGGQNFVAQANFPSRDVRAFVQADSGLLFAATGNRGVLSSRDNGCLLYTSDAADE